MAIVPIPQVAAIPIHQGMVCLVTSRSGRHWVVPKGCLEPNRTLTQIAQQEAWEEAGLLGDLEERPVGAYRYEKSGNVYHVTAFIMQVTEIASHWPEVYRRQRIWVAEDKAHKRVQHFGLREVLRNMQSTCLAVS